MSERDYWRGAHQSIVVVHDWLLMGEPVAKWPMLHRAFEDAVEEARNQGLHNDIHACAQRAREIVRRDHGDQGQGQ